MLGPMPTYLSPASPDSVAPLQNLGMLVFTGLYKVGIGFRIPTGGYIWSLSLSL